MSELYFEEHAAQCPGCHDLVRIQVPRKVSGDGAEGALAKLMEWAGHTVIKEPAASPTAQQYKCPHCGAMHVDARERPACQEQNDAADRLITEWRKAADRDAITIGIVFPQEPEEFSAAGRLDPGIARAVEMLFAEGCGPFESCQGGGAHVSTVPMVRFHDFPWRAVDAFVSAGIPLRSLVREWSFDDGMNPRGPTWRLEFRSQFEALDHKVEGVET